MYNFLNVNVNLNTELVNGEFQGNQLLEMLFFTLLNVFYRVAE